MKALEILFNRRWVLKSEDKDLYYQIRDAVGEVRKYTTEKLGCQIIDNSMLVKMEKIPVIPETFMGIQSFTSKEEYVYLCILLMFLEDKDAQEQFVLSQLTEYMTAVMPGEITDWTVYTNRRRLIRVLRYVVGQGMVTVTDGTDDLFMDDVSGEVLYENTGASKYFMRNFTKDIIHYTHLILAQVPFFIFYFLPYLTKTQKQNIRQRIITGKNCANPAFFTRQKIRTSTMNMNMTVKHLL